MRLLSLNFITIRKRLTIFDCLIHVAENLHNVNKGNSLARSNASLYGNKEELYDRLRRHAYQGKKGIFLSLAFY